MACSNGNDFVLGCSNCNTTLKNCNNPCGVSVSNTPACESLPSQIQNFTVQFFGQVIKTEVNGQIVWSLPCNLDIGLPANPRGSDEGLACYFLRLFRDGIAGLTGPRGLTGAPGQDGANAYTVTVQSFGQPNLNSPLTQIVISPNPVIVEGVGIFVEHSGLYQVTNIAPGGVVFATFVSPINNPLAVIPAGSLVVPMWALTGPAGPQGPQGPQGVAGTSFTDENGIFSGITAGGTIPPGTAVHSVTNAWARVDFTTSQPGFTPAGASTYLVNAVLALVGTGTASASDTIEAQFRTSSGTIFYQTTVYVNNMANGIFINLPLTAVLTAGGSGESVQVWIRTTGADGTLYVDFQGTVLSWVRIA